MHLVLLRHSVTTIVTVIPSPTTAAFSRKVRGLFAGPPRYFTLTHVPSGSNIIIPQAMSAVSFPRSFR